MALHPVTHVLTRLDTQQGGKSANRFPLWLESAMIRTMKTILKTLILTPGLAWAAEQLPDTAPPDDAHFRPQSEAQAVLGRAGVDVGGRTAWLGPRRARRSGEFLHQSFGVAN